MGDIYEMPYSSQSSFGFPTYSDMEMALPSRSYDNLVAGTESGSGKSGGSATPAANQPSGFESAMGMLSGFGGQLSSFASGGGPGTGGMFTSIGTALAGPTAGISIAVGAALDVIFSSSMGDKAKEQAEEAATEYWGQAKQELAQMRKQQAYDMSGINAQIGGSGFAFNSGSFVAGREERNLQDEIAYGKQWQQYKNQYDEIRKSGGKGGIL